MTFTETNTSDQTVMVLTGQNGFMFDQAFAHVELWYPDDLPGAEPQRDGRL